MALSWCPARASSAPARATVTPSTSVCRAPLPPCAKGAAGYRSPPGTARYCGSGRRRHDLINALHPMPSSVMRRAMMRPMSPEPSITARLPGKNPSMLMNRCTTPAVDTTPARAQQGEHLRAGPLPAAHAQDNRARLHADHPVAAVHRDNFSAGGQVQHHGVGEDLHARTFNVVDVALRVLAAGQPLP